MGDIERSVLRRRKQYISEEVLVSNDLIKDLIELGALTEDVACKIQLEKSNQAKMMRIVDVIITHKPEEGFVKLCKALERSYIWLSKDLIGDLKVEKGEVQPQLEHMKEAAVFVHRKFGTSKRFAESDKKKMSEMIAIKLELSQEDWLKETEKLKNHLAETESELKRKDDMAVRINRFQREFVKRNETQLMTHSHDMTTTRMMIQRILEEPTQEGAIFAFKENQDSFLKQMALVLNHRDALYYEKEKCLQMLGVKDKKTKLDDVISRVTGLAINANMEAESKDDIINRIKKDNEILQKLLQAKDITLTECKKQLGDRDREISKLRHSMVHP